MRGISIGLQRKGQHVVSSVGVKCHRIHHEKYHRGPWR